jgi:hypothetical protein
LHERLGVAKDRPRFRVTNALFRPVSKTGLTIVSLLLLIVQTVSKTHTLGLVPLGVWLRHLVALTSQLKVAFNTLLRAHMITTITCTTVLTILNGDYWLPLFFPTRAGDVRTDHCRPFAVGLRCKDTPTRHRRLTTKYSRQGHS